MRIGSLVLAILAGCNVVHLRERSLRAKVERAGLRESEIEVGPDRVHVWRGGRGRPLLLLHGFGASAVWQWHDQVGALARDHDVVMPDLLGFGASGSPLPDASLDHQVAAMIGLLDRLELGEVDVVGMSYGGLVAYALASMHPERVRRLVLVASPGHAWSHADQQALLARFGARSTTALFVPESPDGIRTLMALAWHRRHRVPDWAARQAIAALYDPHRADQIALLEHLERDVDRLAAELTRPRAPTLLVWGRDDPVFPLAVAQRLARELPAALFVIERARHMPNAEHPREFNARVVEFLNDRRTPSIPRDD